jgi:hypothetical protein
VWTNGAIAYDEEDRQVIIWGNKKQREGVGYAIHSCYRCGVTVHVVAEQKSKFTVYFIPVFTYSHKAFLFCSSCSAETELGGEEAKEALASAMPRFMLEALIAGMQDEEVARRENEVRTLAPGRIAKKAKKALAPAKKASVRAKAKKATPKSAKKTVPKKKGR